MNRRRYSALLSSEKRLRRAAHSDANAESLLLATLSELSSRLGASPVAGGRTPSGPGRCLDSRKNCGCSSPTSLRTAMLRLVSERSCFLATHYRAKGGEEPSEAARYGKTVAASRPRREAAFKGWDTPLGMPNDSRSQRWFLGGCVALKKPTLRASLRRPTVKVLRNCIGLIASGIILILADRSDGSHNPIYGEGIKLGRLNQPLKLCSDSDFIFN